MASGQTYCRQDHWERLYSSYSYQRVETDRIPTLQSSWGKFIPPRLEHFWDRSRVLEGHPWIFENKLFAVEEFDGFTPLIRMKFDFTAFWIRMYDLPLVCMEREKGFKIGATVGKVEDVDTDIDGTGWGEYLHVRVHVSLTKPLPRGRTLKLKEKSLWVPFQYEKIPKFCFKCGVISHGPEGRMKGDDKGKQGGGSEAEYGPWLRVPPNRAWLERRRMRS